MKAAWVAVAAARLRVRRSTFAAAQLRLRRGAQPVATRCAMPYSAAAPRIARAHLRATSCGREKAAPPAAPAPASASPSPSPSDSSRAFAPRRAFGGMAVARATRAPEGARLGSSRTRYDVFPRAVRRQRARQLDARLFASCMYFSIRMAYASRIRVNQRACRPRASSSAVTQHGGVHIPATHAHPPVSRSGSLGLVGANRRVHQLRRADALLADRVQVVQEFAHARHLLR